MTINQTELTAEELPDVAGEIIFCKLKNNVFTHGEHSSNGVLISQDECAAIPEGKSVGQVDHEEGEAHGDVSRDRLLYAHVLSILQVLMISVAWHKHTQAQNKAYRTRKI